jgi:solute carrier family 25 protein 16
MVSVFFTYPLEVIRVRLAFETKREGRSSLTSIVRKIYYEHPAPLHAPPRVDTSSASRAAYTTLANATATVERAAVTNGGISNFFRGFTATLCGMLPYAGSSFLAHDTMSDLMRHQSIAHRTTIPGTDRPEKNKPAQLKAWAELTTGGVAGFVSQTVSYPLEVIRRRMQVGGVVGDGHRLRMGEVASRILRERGWRGFFVGLGIGYVKVIPMVAVSFFTYERAKWYLGI